MAPGRPSRWTPWIYTMAGSLPVFLGASQKSSTLLVFESSRSMSSRWAEVFGEEADKAAMPTPIATMIDIRIHFFMGRALVHHTNTADTVDLPVHGNRRLIVAEIHLVAGAILRAILEQARPRPDARRQPQHATHRPDRLCAVFRLCVVLCRREAARRPPWETTPCVTCTTPRGTAGEAQVERCVWW